MARLLIAVCYFRGKQAVEIFHARARRLTRAEYDRIAQLGFFRGERIELIHGIPVQISPIGPAHADVVDRLRVFFVRALAGRARVRIQHPFVAHDESEPEPDVALVPDRSYFGAGRSKPTRSRARQGTDACEARLHKRGSAQVRSRT
jgi:hypothetical protein